MKLALAQINERLGDFDGICSRIEQQAQLAHEAGAQLMCVPAPLFGGMAPGALAEYPNYEHDLLLHLRQVAYAVEPLGIECLIPAVLALEGGQLFEVFRLREGRVVPLRLTMIRHHEELPVPPWAPPVFEVVGTRIAVTFDVLRDLESLPTGCDLVIYFPVNGFDASDETTTAVASVADGAFAPQIERAGLWMACMAPIGGFDSAVYTGGSFVLDDAGHLVGQAPCFEEALLVQEVQRGMMVDAVPQGDTVVYQRELWLWEALRLHLRDAVASQGMSRVAISLRGDLASSLLAVLAVDALGPRNVLGLLVSDECATTPEEQRRQDAKSDLARELADRLRFRLVERTAPSSALVLDQDVPDSDDASFDRAVEELILSDTARVQHAAALSSQTKTDAALRANVIAPFEVGSIAPFADVRLSDLGRLARSRCAVSAVLPESLFGEKAMQDAFGSVVSDAVRQLSLGDEVMAGRCAELLCSAGHACIDEMIRMHVDRNATLDELPMYAESPELSALVVLIVRRNEMGRRRLPAHPIVSSRSFDERLWPEQLAWTDLGLRGEERMNAGLFAEKEYRRLEEKGDEYGRRARGEVMGMLGSMLGLSEEQQRELMSDEGQRRIHAEMHELEGNIREALRRMAGSGASAPEDGETRSGAALGPGFFSLN